MSISKTGKTRQKDCLISGSAVLAAAIVLLELLFSAGWRLAAGGVVGVVLYGTLQRYGIRVLQNLSSGRGQPLTVPVLIMFFRYGLLVIATVYTVKQGTDTLNLLLYCTGVGWYYFCEAVRSLVGVLTGRC